MDLVFVFGIVLLGSALCAMIEAAILSLPLVRARILVDQKRTNAYDVLYLKENIGYAVATIVLLNNGINIAGSFFIGDLVSERYGHQWLGWAATVVTFLIIVFGEIIPKRLGEHYRVRVCLICAKPFRWLVWACKPLVAIILRITDPFVQEPLHLQKVTEDEIKMMLRLGRDAGSVELDEEVLCNRVFKLNDLRAFQIMKPLDQAFALPADKLLKDVKNEIIHSQYSRIIVYEQDRSKIVGIVQQRILMREMALDHETSRVSDFMFKPIFVNWFMKADALLEKFQAYHQHLFIVRDLNNKAVGIVTMEDVLEQLFGAIYDEKDAHHQKIANQMEGITKTNLNS